MTRIQVSPRFYHNVQLATVFSLGATIGSLTGLLSLKKNLKRINEDVSSRFKLIADAYREMEEISKDVSMSGEQRETKVKEIIEFIELVTNQDFS